MMEYDKHTPLQLWKSWADATAKQKLLFKATFTSSKGFRSQLVLSDQILPQYFLRPLHYSSQSVKEIQVKNFCRPQGHTHFHIFPPLPITHPFLHIPKIQPSSYSQLPLELSDQTTLFLKVGSRHISECYDRLLVWISQYLYIMSSKGLPWLS